MKMILTLKHGNVKKNFLEIIGKLKFILYKVQFNFQII
jgi:hypothetical protein